MRTAFIVSAPLEMTLTAGRVEINPDPEKAEDDPPFLNIGRVWGDEIHLSGPLVAAPKFLESTLAVSWYLPGEEKAESARPVDLAGAGRRMTVLDRPPAEPGWRWRYLLESRRPAREIRFYEGGFLPPFKASDLTLNLIHLINFNYNGYILAGLNYGHRPPSYIEAEWREPALESAGFLDNA